ncbi:MULTISPECIES: hypothetical protein [unclassified Halorhabdus]|uniref:hypothetical protein n=1 Tax=unclassified Halorhabdus TaxID=2621901 RepID=UPI0023DC2470|nr:MULTISPECIES: hypothetical protein [unclassified Halorhabdus]WEL16708.1 hypothetical protein SVXHr_0528 [Halorhabdus sp. SVX81]WEL20580.1 hypothetical protein HBNXHr_0506 [Halorhabdus sp. BNX81]
MVEILGEIFSSYMDIHTFQLGVLLGLLVVFAYRDDKRIAYGLLFFGVYFAFGNAAHIGWGGISRKPWYFLTGVYMTTVLGLGVQSVAGSLLNRFRRSNRSAKRNGVRRNRF